MKKLLFSHTDNLFLAIFRMAFGLLMGIHCLVSVYNGQVHRNFIEPPFRFPYIGLEWLNLVPGEAYTWFFLIMALSAFMILAGYRYRFFSFILAFLWTLTYLSQKMDYNNHYYLMVLVCWIMFLVPAHQRLSMDLKQGRAVYATQCKQWVPLLFISLACIMYTYAGLSKLDADWLSGRFLSIMFSRFRNHSFLGGLYSHASFALFISYAGIAFDLLIVPALLWKKTRMPAFLLACLFHIFNAYTFHIGIFPFLGIALNLFFFTPISWRPSFVSGPFVQLTPREITLRKIQTVLWVGFLLLQLLLPLRPYLFPGNTFWNEEGYRMSWKMMGRTKSGWVHFKVLDTNHFLVEKIDPSVILSRTHYMWLSGSPDMIWQYAQRIKRKYRSLRSMDVQVFAVGAVSMNRRPEMPLIDSTVNLAHVAWEPFRHASWIMPMEKE